MSLKYRDSTGNETPVAGLNGTSGELVPSVALYQSGTATLTLPTTAGDYTYVDIALDTPMPDTDYLANVEAYNQLANVFVDAGSAHYKTVNGFRINAQLVGSADAGAQLTVYWQAFKLMTDEVHEADAVHIAQNTANFAPAFSETTSYAVGDYVTYNNILYRCTTAHTAGVWVAGHFTQVTVGGELNNKSSLKPITIVNTTTLGLTAQSTYTFMEYYQALVSHGFGVGHYIIEIQPADNTRVYVNGDFNKTGTVSMNACTLDVNILATGPTRAYQMLATAFLIGTAGLVASLSASTGNGTSVLRSCVNVLSQD